MSHDTHAQAEGQIAPVAEYPEEGPSPLTSIEIRSISHPDAVGWILHEMRMIDTPVLDEETSYLLSTGITETMRDGSMWIRSVAHFWTLDALIHYMDGDSNAFADWRDIMMRVLPDVVGHDQTAVFLIFDKDVWVWEGKDGVPDDAETAMGMSPWILVSDPR